MKCVNNTAIIELNGNIIKSVSTNFIIYEKEECFNKEYDFHLCQYNKNIIILHFSIDNHNGSLLKIYIHPIPIYFQKNNLWKTYIKNNSLYYQIPFTKDVSIKLVRDNQCNYIIKGDLISLEKQTSINIAI